MKTFSSLCIIAALASVTACMPDRESDENCLLVRLAHDGSPEQCWVLKAGNGSSHDSHFRWVDAMTGDNFVVTAPHMVVYVEGGDWEAAARQLGLPSLEACARLSNPVTPEAP
ncbi:MAG: hypothetical protein AAB554_00005 [Patescibacteria group bacterium]